MRLVFFGFFYSYYFFCKVPVAAWIPPTVVPVASSVVFFRPRFVCKDGHLARILIKKVLFDSSGVRTHALSDENLNLAP